MQPFVSTELMKSKLSFHFPQFLGNHTEPNKKEQSKKNLKNLIQIDIQIKNIPLNCQTIKPNSPKISTIQALGPVCLLRK